MIEKNQEVAIKAFSGIKCNSDEKLKAALENEILIMRRLDHKNVIKSYGFFETENSIYIV
jgi:serine/threonine protein kinase